LNWWNFDFLRRWPILFFIVKILSATITVSIVYRLYQNFYIDWDSILNTYNKWRDLLSPNFVDETIIDSEPLSEIDEKKREEQIMVAKNKYETRKEIFFLLKIVVPITIFIITVYTYWPEE